MEVRVRVPQIRSIEEAVRLYYERIELSNADIAALFDTSQGTVYKLKLLARERMAEEDVPAWNARNVNTEVAYRAWGLDIAKLERNLKKLQALRLQTETERGGA